MAYHQAFEYLGITEAKEKCHNQALQCKSSVTPSVVASKHSYQLNHDNHNTNVYVNLGKEILVDQRRPCPVKVRVLAGHFQIYNY